MNNTQLLAFAVGASLLGFGIYELRKNTAAKKESAAATEKNTMETKAQTAEIVKSRSIKWQEILFIAKIMYFVTKIAQCIANIARSIFVA